MRSSAPNSRFKKRTQFSIKSSLLDREEFLVAWSALSYCYPGLHPDGFQSRDSGWPTKLKRYATEAWRRHEAGQFSDDELYACDAQWAGLYDQLHTYTAKETERRLRIAIGRE